MAIARKPKSSENKEKEKEIKALIGKGGSVADDAVKKGAKSNLRVPIIIRVPSDILAQVDEVIKARLIKKPRHTWLLEAVLEKLERESI